MKRSSMAPSQGEINAAAGRSQAGNQPPKSKPRTAGVGNETKADMSGALNGNPTDKNPLRGAMSELKAQHPHGYADHGPHHGDMSHVRHKPMKLS